MRRMLVLVLLVATACADSGHAARLAGQPADTLPSVESLSTAGTVAMLDDIGELAVVDSGTGAMLTDRRGWSSRMSLDGSYAVSTVIVGDGDTKVAWDSFSDGEVLGGAVFPGDELESSATQLDGRMAAFVNPAEPVDGAIAGARSHSTIVLASPADGEVWRIELDGNFVPEAFGSTLGVNGLPTQLFMLEYFPADAPRFYRVRVLSTDSGELSLPLSLRDKSEHVDERMAGFTRSQVVAGEQQLLFTLYRGTLDGTPDGDPYAFVHTLGLGDGVWCLSVDPALELETLPGTLAVGGDRLYVASANGKVGSFDISSISDPDASATMTWVTQVSFAGAEAPLLLADGDGVYLAYGDDQLVRLDAESTTLGHEQLPGPGPTALTRSTEGSIEALGPDWSTIDGLVRPDWLGQVTQLVVSASP